ncbi:MAG TPA: histidine kinase N-terminal domain-containing protein [Terriglobales bacterium]|nr:histidine kinase N-terminal domain-containing protein [Terriglobales bacterium]
MLATRLVRLIEEHSDQLATSLAEKIRTSQRTLDYLKIPPEELKHQAYQIYAHLGDWIMSKTETDIELHYTRIGEQRMEQGIRISDFVWALVITKENLLHYLRTQAVADRALELLGELELLQLVEQFFDRATYYGTAGYERAQKQRKAA